MSDDVKFSPKGQRQISEFVGQELLYDFVTDNLDAERKAAIAKLVAESDSLQSDIKKIKNGLQYCQILAETTVAETLIGNIKTPSTYFHVLLQKMRIDEWPVGIRLGVEVLIVAALVITSALLVPWHKIANLQLSTSKEIVIAEVGHEVAKNKGEISGPKTEEKPLYQDEGAPSYPAGPSTSTTVSVATKKASESKPKALPTTTLEEVAASAVETESSPPTSGQGYLYRGSIAVANLPVTTTKFVEKIAEMGGRKAGEVPLGWKKGNGTYFHFTIPEKQLDTIEKFMNGYGHLKISKEKHPRVMPEGIVRIIITVEERK
jgi:hypothetical protein